MNPIVTEILSEFSHIQEMCENPHQVDAAETSTQKLIERIMDQASNLSKDDIRLVQGYLTNLISDLQSAQLDVKGKLEQNKNSAKLTDIYLNAR